MAIQPINNVNAAAVTNQTKSTGKSTPATSSANVNPAMDDDTVRITSTAQDIKKALDASASTPVVNENKVAELKAALQAGTYQVDPDRVADKMLQLETKLPNTT